MTVQDDLITTETETETETDTATDTATDTDAVTGARVEVELTFPVAPERLWDVITDVSRIGEFSPECKAAGWLDAAAPGPRAGARFQARNEFPGGHSVPVSCLVTEAERPHTYAWVVLDPQDDPKAPSSAWRYELLPGAEPGTTLARHCFTHGSGDSGARKAAQGDPAALRERLDVLRANMTATLTAMAAAAAA